MLSLPDPSIKKSPSKSLLKRVAANLKSSLRVANLLAEEWFRQSMVWFYQHRGTIVIFDRHFFFDYYFHHIVQKASHLTLSERIHGFVLNRFYPKPDLVICLDAPAEVLLSRKGEATLAFLQRRRQEYLLLRHEVKNFVTVDATQPADVVLDEVTNLIQNFYQSRSGRKEQVQVSPQPLERNSLK